MKKVFFTFLFLVFASSLVVQAQMIPFGFWKAHFLFTWINGPQNQVMSSHPGTQGVADAKNHPGIRSLGVMWVDSSGNPWIFGGDATNWWGSVDSPNDLWQFNATSNQWIWKSGANEGSSIQPVYGSKGVGSTNNYPGTRSESTSWTDSSGNLWLFGGGGIDSTGNWGYLNDLWKYNPTNAQWTWVAGTNLGNQNGAYGTKGVGSTANYPGGRSVMGAWMDTTGNVWIFGGWGLGYTGTSASVMNDLWKYNASNGQWTWISGAKTSSSSGTFGTKGVASSSNTPSARGNMVRAYDGSNLWLFSGNGYDGVGGGGYLNDVWKYNIAGNTWTWVAGTNTSTGTVGTYGTKGVASTANLPGGRASAVSYSDGTGNLWVFGGWGLDSAGNEGYLNDLWKFNTSTLTWTWLTGSNLYNQAGTFGTLGTAAAANTPGGKNQTEGAYDSAGNLWLFGGWGIDGSGNETRTNDLWKYNISSGQWTWVSGSSINYHMSTAGTQGVASTANLPSARGWTQYSTDPSGNFWLFGGYGVASNSPRDNLNDLWKFNPSTNQWTWVGGSLQANQGGTYGSLGTASASNIPGARSAGALFTDSTGNLWLFGGNGFDSVPAYGELNDLWKYNVASGQWTWMKGSNTQGPKGVYGTLGVAASANTPGSRDGMASWIDASNNLWVFGGWGYDSVPTGNFLNDLWKYNNSTGQWTWMAGAKLVNGAAVYGTKGTGSTANIPGARKPAAWWKDSSGNFWLFGGTGLDASSSSGDLNDLWKYNPTNGQWTWMSGSNAVGASGTYGTKGVASTAISPGTRAETSPQFWIDAADNLWMQGGYGEDTNGNQDVLSELWRYNTNTGQWTWIAGSNTKYEAGTYGTKGSPSLTNIPGARHVGTTWVDKSGTAWIFGGEGLDVDSNYGFINDFWKFSP